MNLKVLLLVALTLASVSSPSAKAVEPTTQVSSVGTCAAAGYTYTKLEWCKNICERGYTGATLDMWIRRWVDRYRDLPICAAD